MHVCDIEVHLATTTGTIKKLFALTTLPVDTSVFIVCSTSVSNQLLLVYH